MRPLRRFSGLSGRSLRARPSRTVLTATGVALGVSLVLGVGILTRAIDGGFQDLFGAAYGNTDLIVVPQGASEAVGEDVLTRVTRAPGAQDVTGVVYAPAIRLTPEAAAILRRVLRNSRARTASEVAAVVQRARLTAREETVLRTAVQESPRARVNLTGREPGSRQPADISFTDGRDIRGGAEIVVERSWADDQGVRVGGEVVLATPSGLSTFRVVGVYRFETGRPVQGQTFVTVPLAAARRALDRPTGYDEIHVTAIAGTPVSSVQTAVRGVTGSGVRVLTPGERAEAVLRQLDALKAVLALFSAMGLFVGAFMIFNAFEITVLERQRELGMMRALGAAPGALAANLVREAAALGAVGAVGGVAAGIAGGYGLIAMVRALSLPIGTPSVTLGSVLVAVGAGLAVTVLAALEPARRARALSPIDAIEATSRGRRSPARRRAAVGLAFAAVGLVAAAALGTASEPGDIAGPGAAVSAVCLFAGLALLAPRLITPLVKLLSLPVRRLRPIEGRIAADAALANPARTATTASVVAIGFALVVATGTLALSFLHTVDRELSGSQGRDITIQAYDSSVLTSAPQLTFSPRLGAQLRGFPEARLVTPERFAASDAVLPGQRGFLLGFDPAVYGQIDETRYEGGSEKAVLAAVARGQVVVGDALARSAAIDPGDVVVLRGARGTRRVRVAGIARSVLFGGRQLGMSLTQLDQLYGIRRDSRLAIRATSPAAEARLQREIQQVLAGRYPQLAALSSDQLRAYVDEQLRQQVGLFYVLLLVVVVVSLLGLATTLTIAVVERRREIGVLRAIGCRPRQIQGAIGLEGLLVAMAGTCVGSAVGLVMGWTFVAALRSLLPSLQWVVPVETLGAGTVAAVLIGVLAAAVPARRSTRVPVVTAVSYE